MFQLSLREFSSNLIWIIENYTFSKENNDCSIFLRFVFIKSPNISIIDTYMNFNTLSTNLLAQPTLIYLLTSVECMYVCEIWIPKSWIKSK